MNAAHDKHAAAGPKAYTAEAGADEQPSSHTGLSALVDGELEPAELDALLQAMDHDDGLRTTCQRYQLIGDVLRGESAAGTPPYDFVAGVRERLQTQRPVSVAPVLVTPARAPAANDPVFRWKLVAGFASLAAVMAVGWSVIGGAPAASGRGGGEPQLALVTPSASSATEQQASGAVLMNSPHGPVLRDARLEQLLAEYRQYGGMSALQMPAGFLRDATQDTDPQR